MASLSASLAVLSCVLVTISAMPNSQTYPLKDCWFGDCTVTISGSGSNTGTINGVRYGQTDQHPSSSKGISRGQFPATNGEGQNFRRQDNNRPGQECPFGRCNVDIPGDSTKDLYLR